MKSHEIFRWLFQRFSVKEIAITLGFSRTTVYGWGEEGASHRRNPAEQLDELRRLTGDLRLLQWLCERAGGFLVLNPQARSPKPDALSAECEVVQASADYLKAVTEFLKPGARSREKAAQLRSCWEQLKSTGEGLVLGCETGRFRCVAILWALGWWLSTGDAPELAEAG
jgi:hypothetical protein